MRVREVDSQNDWLFGKGQNDYLTQNNAVVQSIRTRLQSFLGDCFFDLGAGIDWFTYLGSKNQAGLTISVASIIINTENVTGLLQLSVVLNDVTRNISIRYQVQSTYSVISDTFVFDLNGSV